MLPAALIVVSYLVGAIPFSFLIAHLVAHKDVREIGSGNVGATNVMRAAGKAAGVTALVLDVLKGWLAIAFARWLVGREDWPFDGSRSLWIGIAALVVVLGHMFPIWLRFRGGKGVATATGVFLALDPRAAAIAFVIFLLVILTTRYISLASMVAAGVVPAAMRFVTGADRWRLVFSIIIAIAVVVKHHENIARLARGSERKFPS
ncbi:MAG TPA: glycerol-3-phosphate 1-O-acyltransferase PlsY [Thermoanaerobaculia bacterium]